MRPTTVRVWFNRCKKHGVLSAVNTQTLLVKLRAHFHPNRRPQLYEAAVEPEVTPKIRNQQYQ